MTTPTATVKPARKQLKSRKYRGDGTGTGRSAKGLCTAVLPRARALIQKPETKSKRVPPTLHLRCKMHRFENWHVPQMDMYWTCKNWMIHFKISKNDSLSRFPSSVTRNEFQKCKQPVWCLNPSKNDQNPNAVAGSVNNSKKANRRTAARKDFEKGNFSGKGFWPRNNKLSQVTVYFAIVGMRSSDG